MKKLHIGLLISLLSVFGLQGQTSHDELIKGLRSKMNEITGFEADALIKVDVDFIDISDREVKVKYTAPDQFEFDAKGIALMPKNGMKMEYFSMLNAENIILPAGEEVIREIQTQKLKVIPESIDSDIVLAQLWMDPQTHRILRMHTFTRESGSYIIDFFFPKGSSILPSKIEVTFDIENLSAPAQMITEFMGNAKVDKDNLPKVAKVIVEYRNMIIHKR